ncbi:cyclophilin-like fold protein [Klebsiella pasteurii]|uniref:Cyclophilin-like fold protein n=1 Tax=Klebsiella pasteurii TaxID=2587529 RepID=A0ABT5CSX1_9ENTR|nr:MULTISPECIES: cyclophilin-like fold protein [Klebsiella]MBG2718583.1 cyclophilin [Klebsiella michiganensis]MDC0693206.1 cyclophilin-like fold protein [Klebsiella pasteurii]MDC0754853.1 cyclophilin-like fold protein [Klebsiella pasteurii]MDQ2169678.1 cyclophilin-like fold protein [Klebsiella pasteurii]MDQ2201259.1 cyclophilin-like fold protein [Klebsiella pasteurii]
MLKTLGAVLSILIMMTGAASAAGRENAVKIEFVFKGVTVVGLLDESAAANAFLAQLPMTVKLEDYGSTEKIAWLPTKLRRADSGASMTPRRGDIAYYAPWGNLAIFREDFRHSPGLVKLGRVVEGLKSLDQPGAAMVTISRSAE